MYVIIEGIDGAGKSTVVDEIARRMPRVLSWREPLHLSKKSLAWMPHVLERIGELEVP
jgi:thymidylate kinase